MKARDLIKEAANPGAAAGFRKAGRRVARQVGGVDQVVEFQLLAYNFANAGRFFINVGLAFDELWALDGEARPGRLAAPNLPCPVAEPGFPPHRPGEVERLGGDGP